MNIDTNRPIVNHLSGTLADFGSPGAVTVRAALSINNNGSSLQYHN